ncbi:MAG: T9SS type A sorting domain-containing protein [Flavobacteriales bacterium]|nr:T9SS type A sorting domain-containing protein [Flavobacteriales bacterium]
MKHINQVLSVSIFLLVSLFSFQFANAQCQASYTYSNTGNGEIVFTNTSTGGTEYLWDFGDGSTSINLNESHTFSNGTFTICLTITDSASSCTSTFCDSLTIDTSYVPPCLLYAEFSQVQDSVSGAYTFTPNITGATYPVTYQWYFDDGGSSNDEEPTHNFLYDHIYLIYLSVTDAEGCNYVVEDSMYFDGANTCNIVAGFNYTDNGNGEYSFESTSTGNIAYHLWSFGGSSSVLLTPSCSFPMDGLYEVVLYVCDSSNYCHDYYTETITVSGVLNPIECNASFSIFTDSTYNGVYVVNSSGGDNLSYFWDFGDGNTSNLPYPNYIYGSGGPFELCLTVASDSGCTSTFCDSISSGGIVNKQNGFEMTVIPPITTNVDLISVTQINSLKVYPNPFNDFVYVSFNVIKPTVTSIVITDVLGNTIETLVDKEISGLNTFVWNAENKSNGIYFLKILTPTGLNVEKLLLNR